MRGKLLEFVVPLPPVPQARHRVGRGRMYDPSVGAKQQFMLYASRYAPEDRFKGELEIGIDLTIARPKNHYGTGRNKHKLKDNAPKSPVTRPDIDNYLKLYMDAMNKVFWEDDSQIVVAHARKRYISENEIPNVAIRLRYEN